MGLSMIKPAPDLNSDVLKDEIKLGVKDDQMARPLILEVKDRTGEASWSKEIVDKATGYILQDDEDYKKYYNSLLGHTILPRNPWIVLNGSYLLNPTNLCTQHRDLDLVVVVHTAPYNFIRRRMLREAFTPPRLQRPYTAQVVFMLGTLNSTTIDLEKEKNLSAEINKHGDIVRMEFQEGFRNLTYKAMLWLRWLDEFCPNAMMVLKLDDDVVMDVRKVLPLSRGLFSKFERSIFCSINARGTQPIPRIGRTRVDPREFAGVKIYPYTYCSGFIVFLSRDLITSMAEAVRRTPMYNVDDLFIFGMVAKMTGNVTYHNIGYNITLWHDKVYNCTVADGIGCSPQQGDLRLSGPPSGQGAGGGARTRDRMVPADLRADSLATVPPTPPFVLLSRCETNIAKLSFKIERM
ncbi:hexosyltransferase [Plakobranchus ocellatus]|uniref:Hexosyltransferase n=1 Tax=Plakobranchus ocellatus TaxID=259542 RepID=A0AAV3XV69_9GAST|nr:hexosyltransferase [Plakobranchus ocellatus]